MKKICLCALIIATCGSVNALVNVDINGGWSYVNNHSINGISATDHDGFGWNANVGISLPLPWTSIEFGYTNFSAPEYLGDKTTLNSFDLAGVLRIPLVLHFSAIGKIGMGYTYMSSSQYTGSEHKLALYWALGLGFNLNENIYTQLMYQQYRNNGNIPNTGLLSLGIGYNFM
ncbi:outer membrane beta-barrel protein [Cysteiniphilum litorale]|uniref:outer membrane beta-barrel protein n=1 Tax=Cysteiniphilum litorale TaxID=2056700 RepID=UPI003F8852B3